MGLLLIFRTLIVGWFLLCGTAMLSKRARSKLRAWHPYAMRIGIVADLALLLVVVFARKPLQKTIGLSDFGGSGLLLVVHVAAAAALLFCYVAVWRIGSRLLRARHQQTGERAFDRTWHRIWGTATSAALVINYLSTPGLLVG